MKKTLSGHCSNTLSADSTPYAFVKRYVNLITDPSLLLSMNLLAKQISLLYLFNLIVSSNEYQNGFYTGW